MGIAASRPEIAGHSASARTPCRRAGLAHEAAQAAQARPTAAETALQTYMREVNKQAYGHAATLLAAACRGPQVGSQT